MGNKNGISSPGNTGMKHTDEHRKKISDAGIKRYAGKKKIKIITEDKRKGTLPKLECPFCHTLCSIGMLNRWHGTKCKLNQLNSGSTGTTE